MVDSNDEFPILDTESKDDFPTLNIEVIDALKTKKQKALAISENVLHLNQIFKKPGMKAEEIYHEGRHFFKRADIDPGSLRSALYGAKKSATSRIISPKYTRYYLDNEPESLGARNLRENLLYPAICSYLTEILDIECFSAWSVRCGDTGENPDITAISTSNPSIRVEHAIEVKSRLKLLREGFNLALGYQDLAYHSSVVVAVCRSRQNSKYLQKIVELAKRRGIGLFVAILDDQEYRAFIFGGRQFPFSQDELEFHCLALPKKTDPAVNPHNDYLVRLGVASAQDLDKWLKKEGRKFGE